MISEIACVILIGVICANAADVSLSTQPKIFMVTQQELRGNVNLTKISVNSSIPFSKIIPTTIKEDDLSKATFSIHLPVLNENVSLSDSITVTSNGSSLNLTIMSPNENYYGLFYVQIFVDDKFVSRVEVNTGGSYPIIAKGEASKRVVEGKSATFYCDVRGIKENSGTTIAWLRPDKQAEWNSLMPVSAIINNASRLNITTKRHTGDTLHLIELKSEDGGSYVCRVTVGLVVTHYVYELRVKDRLAALWPFIGIVIEIIILVVAILVYEQRRSKQAKANKEAEKATLMAGGDQQGGKADDHGEKDAETRLRAVKA